MFHSPDSNGDGLYENNRTCHWTIIRTDVNKLLQLKILYMDIETSKACRSDYLKVTGCHELKPSVDITKTRLF